MGTDTPISPGPLQSWRPARTGDADEPIYYVTDAQVWSAEQSLQCDVYLLVEGTRVRVRIRRNAFDFQSSARVYVWVRQWEVAYERHDIRTLPIAGHSYTSRSPESWALAMAASCRELLADWFRTGVGR